MYSCHSPPSPRAASGSQLMDDTAPDLASSLHECHCPIQPVSLNFSLCFWDRPGDTGVSKYVQKWFWVLQCTLCQQGFRSWHKLKELGEPMEKHLAGRTEAWLDGNNEAFPLIQVCLWCFPWFCNQTQKETDLDQISNLNEPSWHSQVLREVRLQSPLALFWSLIKNRSPLKCSCLGWWQ